MPSTRPEDFFRDYRAWGWIKHMVYGDYLWPWANKVGSTSPNIFVVEPFAGAGTYRSPDGSTDKDGSPVIAAKAARHYQAVYPGRTMKVIAVERNRANYRKLAERLQPLKDVVTVYPGDFHDRIAEIVETIGAAPALINFDPCSRS